MKKFKFIFLFILGFMGTVSSYGARDFGRELLIKISPKLYLRVVNGLPARAAYKAVTVVERAGDFFKDMFKNIAEFFSGTAKKAVEKYNDSTKPRIEGSGGRDPNDGNGGEDEYDGY